MTKRLLDRPLLHIALIVLLGVVAYSNTFHVPFQFDDTPAILENPKIKTVSNIPALLSGLSGEFASRPLMQATLALNYHFGGADTWGYHAVNLLFHLLNGMLLYLLVVMTGRHLEVDDQSIRPLALLSALLFIVHPMQTQAVTYITSRSVLFAATFCLAGVMLFLKSVTAQKKRGLYIAGLFIVSLMGMGSRENFATFPLLLLLYDLFFVSKLRPKEVLSHYKSYVPVLLSLIYMVHLVMNNTYDRSAQFPTMDIPHAKYALTQFKVQWTYLRLLALPINQNLDYDYPISRSLFELPTLLAFIGYLGLWCLGISFAGKRPLSAFSALWFLVALMPISFGVTLMKNLKLNDVIFEHRLYLPALAFFPFAAAGVFYVSKRFGPGRRNAFAFSLSTFLVIVLFSATIARNTVWRSETSLWEDVVKKSPMKAMAHNNLGNAYDEEGAFENAVEQLQTALRLKPDFAEGYYNLGIIFKHKGIPDVAIDYLQKALTLKPDYADAHNNLGVIYRSKGQLGKAVEQYLAAVRLKPYNAEIHNNLGNAYRAMGLYDSAIAELQTALRLTPDYADAYNNLGIVYSSTGMPDKAITSFQSAVRVAPDSADSHFNLGLAYLEKGSKEEARREFEAALRIDPNHRARQYLK